jgi:hypothetical protein
MVLESNLVDSLLSSIGEVDVRFRISRRIRKSHRFLLVLGAIAELVYTKIRKICLIALSL